MILHFIKSGNGGGYKLTNTGSGGYKSTNSKNKLDSKSNKLPEKHLHTSTVTNEDDLETGSGDKDIDNDNEDEDNDDDEPIPPPEEGDDDDNGGISNEKIDAHANEDVDDDDLTTTIDETIDNSNEGISSKLKHIYFDFKSMRVLMQIQLKKFCEAHSKANFVLLLNSVILLFLHSPDEKKKIMKSEHFHGMTKIRSVFIIVYLLY